MAVGVDGRSRRTTMGGIIEPAIAAQVDASIDLGAGVIHALYNGAPRFEKLSHADQDTQLFRRRVVFINVRAPLGRKVIADGGIVFTVFGGTVSPHRPWIARVGLARIVHEVHGG